MDLRQFIEELDVGDDLYFENHTDIIDSEAEVGYVPEFVSHNRVISHVPFEILSITEPCMIGDVLCREVKLKELAVGYQFVQYETFPDYSGTIHHMILRSDDERIKIVEYDF